MTTRRGWSRWGPVALLAWGVAFGAWAAEPAVADFQQKLRTIETARLRGTVDAVRLRLKAQAQEKPSDVPLRIELAWCDAPSDDAWNALKGVAAIYPENPWPHLGMGRIYVDWKMRDQARSEFELALKSNPRFYPAMVGLGDLARLAGDPAQAVTQYRAALAIEDDPRAHAGLGLALAAQKDLANAKKELQLAVQQWPEQPEALRGLAQLARDEKDLATAADWAEKLAGLTPKDPKAQRTLAELRFAAGDKQGAVKAYARLVRMGPVEPAVYERLAALERELGDADGERQAVEHLATVNRDDPQYPVRLAELAEARGDLEHAEAQLLEAVERAPKRADLRLQLARLRVKRDHPREALEAYRAALAAPEQQSPDLKPEADALLAKFKLPARPVSGDVNRIYARVAANLNRLFVERLKEKPSEGGKISLRVRVDQKGNAQGVDVVEDTVGDPYLTGQAYFTLKDARYPKKKREPVFEFELKPRKGK